MARGAATRPRRPGCRRRRPRTGRAAWRVPRGPDPGAGSARAGRSSHLPLSARGAGGSNPAPPLDGLTPDRTARRRGSTRGSAVDHERVDRSEQAVQAARGGRQLDEVMGALLAAPAALELLARDRPPELVDDLGGV